MSDTARPPARFHKIVGRCLLVLLVLFVGFAVYAGYVHSAVRSDAPYEFEPFRYRPLEKSFFTAKFELQELPARLLGGPSEVKLNGRELNALLFGEARHEQNGEKARVLIEGDALRVQVSAPISDTPDTQFYNVDVLVKISIGPEAVTLSLLEGQVGDYSLGFVTRPVVEQRMREALSERFKRDARLSRVRAMTVESGQVILTYEVR